MASKDRFSKLKVYKYTPGGMALSFILLFAGIGTYVLTQSQADTTSYANFYGQSNALVETGVSGVTDSVNSAGTQSVSQVSSGSKLTYIGMGKSKFRTVCYYVRAVSGPGTGKTAKVEFVGQGSSKVFNFAVSDNYQSFCVKSGHKTQKSHNVYNASGPNGPDVNVYQAITSS